MARSNPFHPSFGILPPVLIGREGVLADVRDGLLEGPGSPLRVNKIVGPRGVGKTVALEAAARVAESEGWIVVSVTPSSDMLDEMLDVALERTAHLRDLPARSITGASVAGVSLSVSSPAPEREPGWRVQMERILTLVESHETGLFFTIDEMSDTHESLQIFGKRFQHFRREGRSVALAVAGLRLNIDAFEALKDTSFIRRAQPQELGNVPIFAVRNALRSTFEDNGKHFDPEALRMAADATEGYPFLIQLVGYHTWRLSQSETVTVKDVERGAAAARRRIGDTVHTSAMADLSTLDKTFLVKMAVDEGPSRMGDITARAKWSSQQSNVYRTRLIRAGMIRPAGHGLVQFAVPGLREYLQEHAATLVWNGED